MISRDRKRRLLEARAWLLADPLRPAASPSLAGALLRTAAALFGVRLVDLDNLLAWPGDSEAWLEAPVYPSGCSVGGGIARIPELEGLRREAVVDHNRHFLRAVMDITSEGSAAGYDSHGISLAVVDLASREVQLVGAKTSGDIDERGHITLGQLLRKVPGLEQGTSLVLVAGAQTRAATQGDNMYSSANAHLHTERMTREVLGEALARAELERVRARWPLVSDRDGPFHVGHNGDVNSKIRWEKYFLARGFQSNADSDSKEIPRIQRILFECLQADAILEEGDRCLAWLLEDLAARRVLPELSVLDERGSVEKRSMAEQCSALRALAARMRSGGASLVSVAGALAARLISFVDPTSVYVFETLTSIPSSQDSLMPVTTLVRGPRAGGMILYRDADDPAMPIKFASNLANLRAQIRRYDSERREEVPVDYITTGARVSIREGEVTYLPLDDWSLAEVGAAGGLPGEPDIRVFDLLSGERVEATPVRSPIIDYRLQGQERSVTLRARGEFEASSRVDRTVVYDTVLGEILSGPTSILRKQIKSFPTEEPVTFAVDNQYGAELLLAFVTLLRNTRQLFTGRLDEQGRLQSEVSLRPESLFRLDGTRLNTESLAGLLRRVRTILGLGEGTSRNVLGMAFAAAQLEGLDGVHTSALESNLARMQSPRVDEQTLLAFVSNSGGTKPVVALAEETLERIGESWQQGPFVWAVTNLVTSELARLAARSLGASVTNLPWEKAVGSTFAAFTAYQNLLAMLVYLHQARGLLKPARARHLYRALASFPSIARQTLAYPAARSEVKRLACWIAGNDVDIAFVGALEGFDAAEGALKFSEMMQHSRVKWYSGAYEQHGQRATYLRCLRTNPGTLVIIHVPNLETTIGSWMAQLIREDRPRCGQIAVICAQEDALTLRESGADFVIPAPEGTTRDIFSDQLTKLLLDNMLTEAAIEESNAIAGRLAGWGNRLLDAAGGKFPVRQATVLGELKRIRHEFTRMEQGPRHRDQRMEAVVELERQAAARVIDESQREQRLEELCRGERMLTASSAEARQRISELLELLTLRDFADEPEVFDGLLWDLVLELSDRSLAMRVADERYPDDADRARTAVHYQGLAKVLGANPIKPDNIAKFQQGWGIASFLLPPGRRRSHPSFSLERCLQDSAGGWRVQKDELARLGFSPDAVERMRVFGELAGDLVLERAEAAYHAGIFTFRTPGGEDLSVDPRLMERVLADRRPDVSFRREKGRLVLAGLAVDPFGDPDQLLRASARVETVPLEEQERLIARSPYLAARRAQVEDWLEMLGEAIRRQVAPRITAVKLLSLEPDELRDRVKELAHRAQLASEIPLDLPTDGGFDLLDVTAQNLQTLRNVSVAVRIIRGSTLYRVERVAENGREEFMAIRDPDSLTGIARERPSRFTTRGKLRGNKRIAASGRRLKMGYGKDGAPVIIIPAEDPEGEIFQLLLLHPEIDESLSIDDRIRTLGGKYRLIVDLTSEHVEWNDVYLARFPMVDLMMLSDEEIADGLIGPRVREQSRTSGK